MRKLIGIGMVIGALCSAAAYARELRTPLPLWKGYIHYPVDRNDAIENCFGLDINTWGAGYARTAVDAYGKSRKNCEEETSPLMCGNSNPRKVELTELIFGAADFTLAQAFANSVVSHETGPVNQNPWVSVSTLSPRIDYEEMGAFFGLSFAKRFGCEDRWRVGVRASLPYRDIDIEERREDSEMEGATLNDVWQVRRETNQLNPLANESTNNVFAARLDFLAALNDVALDLSGNAQPLVRFHDSAGKIAISGQVISDPASTAVLNDTNPPVDLVYSDAGVPTTARWGNKSTNGAIVVASNGSGLGDFQRGRFASDVDYSTLGSDQVAQSKLWVVPNVDMSDNGILGNAQTVQTAIANAMGFGMDQNVGDYLNRKGVYFTDSHVKGVGDLDVELFLSHSPRWKGCHCSDFWGELQLGMRAPTAERLSKYDMYDLYKEAFGALGNNGHFEVRPGFAFGCKHWDNIFINIDGGYSFVLKRAEWLPAAFTGATVRNIGTPVLGNVSWQYFLGHANLTFMHPRNQSLGWTVGYEVYAKRKDKVHFCQSQAIDFNNVVNDLDASILRCGTGRLAHRIRAESFFACKCANFYAGFAQTLAGKNIPRDTDWYFGMNISY